MIFIELEDQVISLDSARIRIANTEAGMIVRLHAAGEIHNVHSAELVTCRAVLARIMNLIDAAPLTGVRIIRRKQYMPDDSNTEGEPK